MWAMWWRGNWQGYSLTVPRFGFACKFSAFGQNVWHLPSLLLEIMCLCVYDSLTVCVCVCVSLWVFVFPPSCCIFIFISLFSLSLSGLAFSILFHSASVLLVAYFTLSFWPRIMVTSTCYPTLPPVHPLLFLCTTLCCTLYAFCIPQIAIESAVPCTHSYSTFNVLWQQHFLSTSLVSFWGAIRRGTWMWLHQSNARTRIHLTKHCLCSSDSSGITQLPSWRDCEFAVFRNSTWNCRH